jgi:peptide/nickel transport system ATP-binding protein
MENKPILEVKDLRVYFDIKQSLSKDLLGKGKKTLKAVDGVSFQIREGEILSLVGESGSGKTTTGKAILQLVKPTGGEILFRGQRVLASNKTFMKQFRQKAQMVFQDPYQSINPRKLIYDIVAEPLVVNRLTQSEEDCRARVTVALEQAGMVPAEEFFNRYPHELSGGQRQRVVLASSMIMHPDFVVADEPVSMLDASIRTGILRLMMDLRESRNLSFLFITHDLSLAWILSDRIAIMYLGRIVEIGPADQILKQGAHPYTKALTAIMPIPGVNRGKQRVVLPGEIPDPSEAMEGCSFRSRCKYAKEQCAALVPDSREIGPDHFVACHFAGEL